MSRFDFSVTDDQRHLITLLREEAREVKDCYTKFSFQALAITVAVFSLFVNFYTTQKMAAFSCVAIILVLIMVSRIGTFKYGTANRNFGYELHLSRSRHLKPSVYGWQPYMSHIGWEEAMAAWRIVQSTLFETLYHTNGIKSNRLKKVFRQKDDRWFEPKTEVASGTMYYAGSYLLTMNGFLHFLACLSFVPLVLVTRYFYFMEPEYFLLSLAAVSTLAGYTVLRIRFNIRRLQILEGGLLCIHSCAIVWRSVVICHYRVLKRIQDSNEPDLNNYNKYLSEEASDLAKNIFNIPNFGFDSEKD